MRNQGAMLVVALFLISAAPASAVTGGFGVAKALRSAPGALTMTAQQSAKAKHSICETSEPASSQKRNHTNKRLPSLFFPVACEQPPRTRVITNDPLGHAVQPVPRVG